MLFPELKVPVPELVQSTPEATVIEAFSCTPVLLEHMVAGPASIVGVGANLKAMNLETGLHNPFPVEVRVRIMEPENLSPAEGAYVVIGEFSLAKVPVPEVVHFPLDAFETLPVRLTDETDSQTVWLGPAVTTGIGAIYITIFLETALHVPFPVVVRVNVASPEVI